MITRRTSLNILLWVGTGLVVSPVPAAATDRPDDLLGKGCQRLRDEDAPMMGEHEFRTTLLGAGVPRRELTGSARARSSTTGSLGSGRDDWTQSDRLVHEEDRRAPT